MALLARVVPRDELHAEAAKQHHRLCPKAQGFNKKILRMKYVNELHVHCLQGPRYDAGEERHALITRETREKAANTRMKLWAL